MQHYNFCLSRQDAVLFKDKHFPDTSASPPLPTDVADNSTRTTTRVPRTAQPMVVMLMVIYADMMMIYGAIR